MSGLSKNKLSEMSEVDILNSEKFGLWEVLLFSRLNQNLHLLNNDWEWMCGIKKILWHTNGAQLISVLKGVIVLCVCVCVWVWFNWVFQLSKKVLSDNKGWSIPLISSNQNHVQHALLPCNTAPWQKITASSTSNAEGL